MEVIYMLIPGMMFFGLVFVVVLFWAVKKGQYDDLEGEGSRILMDDDDIIPTEMRQKPKDQKPKENTNK